MELIRTPKDMDELFKIARNTGGSPAETAMLAQMAYQLGYKEGYESGKSFVFSLVGPGIGIKEET